MNASIFAFLTSLASLTAPTALSVGNQAPDFEVVDIAGETLSLDAMTKQGSVVLAFFPMANTSGCTEEMSTLTAQHAAISKAGARVVAISGDNTAKLTEFKAHVGAPFAFVADDKGVLMRLYGVKMPILNKSRRTTLVVGRDKQIKLILKEGDAVSSTGLQQKLDELALTGH